MIKYFHEKMEEEEKILKISLEQSRRNKKERMKDFKLPEYYNTSKPKEENKEPMKDRKCNLCSKVVPMTRFQRFCDPCRRRASTYNFHN